MLKKGALLAMTVASLTVSGCAENSGAYSGVAAQVRCIGANSCKGQSDCAFAGHGCKGMNQCRGTGWLFTTDQNCTMQGGKAI